ncbi:integrase family protein [Archaeoglobus profundus DSM 5631]|uniref:Integrase family protein n=1 Tax=Archaeoglobus profundus (strain DSM 5631 / JCM 9629 / NBRC 100127 / Av18) TaxID=572546 RepID=D2REH8_ARCPA|nr:integrase family protein [Archaeoglobus profundus DSM 5631]
MELKAISDDEKQRYKTVVLKFLEDLSYNLDDKAIINYINKLKKEFAPKTARMHIIRIRAFLKFIDHPIANLIELPKVPKRRRRLVIKVEHVRDLLREIDEKLSGPYRLKLKSAVLLSATSGLRAEELYKLRLEDIDLENRTIFVRAEIAKDYEDRVTFFSKEAQDVLEEYLNTFKPSNPLFSKKSLLHQFSKLDTRLRMKHMRKFFSQQSDRLGMPTAVKKILMGHSTAGDVDLSHYDFQDEEELKKIYDEYWKNFRILG